MKLGLIILSLYLFIGITSAQDAENLGKSFVMKQNYFAKQCDAVGANLTKAPAALERTFIVTVEAMTATGYVIKVPLFKPSDRQNYLNERFAKTKAIDEVKNADGTIKTQAKPSLKLYFFIPFKDFDTICEKKITKHSFTVGIPTIPAKLRFGNGGTGEDPRYFRFEGNLSLGLSGGYKYSFGKNNKYAINGLFGFTIAAVAVDSMTTKGLVNSNTSVASFSPHLGLVFDVNSFQFGLYTGIDFLYGKPNKHWVYRNQVWLGIGIGYSLFNTEREKKKN
ncbi:MAG: hypothetical protein AB8E82_17865 [Aureispira sp.]